MSLQQLICFFWKKTFFFYIIVGGLSAFIYFVSFTVCWKYYFFNYKISISIAYVLSVITHFILNRRLTFGSYQEKFHPQLARYLLMVLLNYCITFLVVRVVVTDMKLSPYIGIVLSIGATLLTGYLMSKNWVFKKQKEAAVCNAS